MNCTRVDHVGIAVKDLAASVKWYEETLGLHSKGTEVVQEQQVTVAFLPCGDSELELLESTSPESCWNCVKGSEDNDYGGKAGSA